MPSLTRNERLVLAAITATGVALRAEGLGELSLAHFDEGVLMSGAFDTRLHGLWHFTLAQPLQAPPLYPWLVSGLMWLTGMASPLMGAYVSAVVGSATVPLMFLLARRTGGNRAGLIAAGLLATSDLHIAFSRMALTEATLTFGFVLAMYAFVRLADAQSGPGLRPLFVWTLVAGFCTGACWNTKYNGWMPCAIAATAWCTGLARRSFFKGKDPPLTDPQHAARLGAALLLASAIAVGCFLPWYRYVEQSFPGGYAAVTSNHLNYVGGLADWPRRAARLFTSLSAFRHYGWLVTMAALSGVVVWQAASICLGRRPDAQLIIPSWAAVALGTLALVAMTVLGSDAVCLLLAIAAIVPALVWGRAEHLTLAVWVGAFLVATPFYHPYTRLLVPALPGAVCLIVWLGCAACGARPSIAASTSAATPDRRRSPRMRLAAIGGSLASMVAASAIALAAHPFGWVPTPALWHRWSTLHSYRAFNDAVREHTPVDAHILCQGMPIMPLYIERRWDSLGHVPFTAWMDRVPAQRPCYLAVDFWGLYGEHHEAARQAIAEQLGDLDPVAWVEDDLNVVTLLDYLSPAEAARRISRAWPPRRWQDSQGRLTIMPAEPRDDYANLIVLYRVDARAIEGSRRAGPSTPARRPGE